MKNVHFNSEGGYQQVQSSTILCGSGSILKMSNPLLLFFKEITFRIVLSKMFTYNLRNHVILFFPKKT